MTNKKRDKKGDKKKQRETRERRPETKVRQKGDKADKGRQSKSMSAQHQDTPWETKQPHRSPVSTNTTEDKGRQRETKKVLVSAQHPDIPWETKGDKGRRGDKATSSQPSIQTYHGRQWETRGDKGGQRETSGDRGRKSSWPSIVSMQEFRTPHSKAVWGINK